MVADLELLYDLGSPYSYLASTQVGALATRAGVRLVLGPFSLGAVFKEQGIVAGATIPARRAYIEKDLQRWARRYGVPFVLPESYPADSQLADCAALSADEQGVQLAAMAALFAAHFVHGRDVANPEVVVAALDGAGLDGRSLAERAASAAIRERLRQRTDAAIRRGAFGAPTLFVGDEMFWGNDRLDFVEDAVAAARG